MGHLPEDKPKDDMSDQGIDHPVLSSKADAVLIPWLFLSGNLPALNWDTLKQGQTPSLVN